MKWSRYLEVCLADRPSSAGRSTWQSRRGSRSGLPGQGTRGSPSWCSHSSPRWSKKVGSLTKNRRIVILLSYKKKQNLHLTFMKYCGKMAICKDKLQREFLWQNDKITELIIIIGNKWTDCYPRFLVSSKLCFNLINNS